jgi:hypothetical protein
MPLPPLVEPDDRHSRREFPMPAKASLPLKLLIRKVPGGGAMRSLRSLPEASPLSKVVAPDVKGGKHPLI